MAEEIMEEQAVDEAKIASEAQAKILGWRPKEEFVGDVDRWRDAEAFLKHGQDTLPILRENNKRLLKEFQELKGTFKDFTEHHKKTVKITADRAYEKAVKDIQDEQRKAVEDGDLPKYDALEQKKEKIPIPEESTPPQQGAKDPLLVAWESENPWYGGDSSSDINMTAYAEQLSAVLLNKGYSLDTMLPKISECMKEQYPDYGKNKLADRDATVSTPTRGASQNTGKKGKSYNDLPAEAKEACDRFVEEGFDKKQYLEDYFGEE